MSGRFLLLLLALMWFFCNPSVPGAASASSDIGLDWSSDGTTADSDAKTDWEPNGAESDAGGGWRLTA